MADEGFRVWTEDIELQPADFPTSSLASLHLMDEAVVINENTNHMGDNPEPHSVCPLMMSSPLNQSQQLTDMSMAIRPEPSPADQGKIKDAIYSIFTHQYINNDLFDNSNCDPFEQSQQRKKE